MSDIKHPYAQQATFTTLQGSWTTIAYQMPMGWLTMAMQWLKSQPLGLSCLLLLCYVCTPDALFLEPVLPPVDWDSLAALCFVGHTWGQALDAFTMCRLQQTVSAKVMSLGVSLSLQVDLWQ